MQSIKAGLILAALVATLLTACNQDARLAAENSQLRAELTQQAEKTREQLDWGDRQAAIAAGCDFLVPLCPDSVTAPGRVALTQGYGPGPSWILWAWLIGKLMIVLMLASGTVVAFQVMHARLVMPAQQRLNAAQELVAQAEERQKEADRNADEATNRFKQTEQRVNEAKTHLEALQHATKIALEELEKTQKDIEVTKQVKATMQNF